MQDFGTANLLIVLGWQSHIKLEFIEYYKSLVVLLVAIAKAT